MLIDFRHRGKEGKGKLLHRVRNSFFFLYISSQRQFTWIKLFTKLFSLIKDFASPPLIKYLAGFTNLSSLAQLAGVVEYTDCNHSREVRSLHLPTSVLDMTLNYLMVRLQSWSFGECGVPPSLPLFPGLLWPEVVVPDRLPSFGQIDRLTARKQMIDVE